MYTKVFRQIYDGTLADNWQALVTFQQLLILADENGMVDMTLAAIHRTTGIPVEILQQGIAILEAPDHGSRTPDMEGRRIARMDAHRDWGWFLVNFKKYRQITSRDDKKEADRARIADKRSAKNISGISNVAECRDESQPVASCSEVSQVSLPVADVAHTEADTETKKEPRKSSASPAGSRLPPDWAPTETEIAWAKRKRPDIDVALEAENFRDFWIAKPGSGGRKSDWPATWRNWIRNANAPRRGGAAAGGVGYRRDPGEL